MPGRQSHTGSRSRVTIALGALLTLGIRGAGITSPWQHRVEHLAGPGTILAASLPTSAGNHGDAIGTAAAAVATRSLRPALAPRAAVPGEPEPAAS